MNEEGEYIKKTQCQFCKNKDLIERFGYPGCINVEGNKCTWFSQAKSKTK